jgi:glycosyltransferase involved in cell wall biosynthesis
LELKSKKSKYLLWTSSFLPRLGGLETASKEYALHMKKQGWDVHIITNRHPRSLPGQECLHGIKIFRYFFFHTPLNYIRNHRPDLFFAWLIMKPVTLFKLLIHFFRTRPDVVNLHFPDHQLFECYLLKHLFRFKLIISLHGNEVERMCTLSKRSIKYYLYNKLFISSVIVTGCSQYLLDQFHVLFPHLNRNKYMPLHNGVNSKFSEQKLIVQKNGYILTAARFVPKKGLDLLIKATRQFTGIHLLIAGGDENDLLDLGLKQREGMILLGPLSQEELAKYLADTNLTVIPSRKEPYGIIVAEALCCGSPVVATNVGGIQEVLSLAREKLDTIEKEVFERWVMLVEPNVESIRNGVDAVLNNNSSIKDYMSLVPKFREQFFWEKRLEKYLSILNSY